MAGKTKLVTPFVDGKLKGMSGGGSASGKSAKKTVSKGKSGKY